MYEEPGQPRQQQAGQAAPAGAHPGYAGGLEAMYGGGSMRGSAAELGANDTAPESGDGSYIAFNQTREADAASAEQPQLPEQDTGANKTAQQSTQVPHTLAHSTAEEERDVGVARGNDTGMTPEPENAGLADNTGLEDTELTTGVSPDPELMNNSTASADGVSSVYSEMQSAAEDNPSTGSHDISEEPVVPEGDPARDSIDAEAEDPPATLSARLAARGKGETATLEQDEPVQQGGDSGVPESALSDASEDEVLHVPRQGTMPEPPEETEDSPVTAAAEIPLQVDEQDPAEGGVEGGMQPDPSVEEEENGGARREAAAAARRERVPLIGKVLGKMRWPEEGPSRPRGSTEEVQRTGAVGASERGATGSGKAGGVTGPASEADRVTETTDSSATPEKAGEEEVLFSEVVEDSGEEPSDGRTEILDSPAVPEEEEEPVSEKVDKDSGEGNNDSTGDDSGVEASGEMPPGRREADESPSVEHIKDEL